MRLGKEEWVEEGGCEQWGCRALDLKIPGSRKEKNMEGEVFQMKRAVNLKSGHALM